MKIILIAFTSIFVDYVSQLANALSIDNELMVIFACSDLPAAARKKFNKRIQFKFIRKNSSINVWKNFSWPKSIKETIEEFNPNIIHLQNSNFRFTLLIPAIIKYPLVTTLHDVIPHQGEDNIISRIKIQLICMYSDIIIVHGKNLKKLLLKKYGDDTKVSVIPHGNMHQYNVNTQIIPRKNNILFFGRMFEYKGLSYLIKAEPYVSETIKNFEFVIAGKGEDLTKNKKYIVNNRHFVIHDEFLSESKMIKLFSQCSIVILPYIEASQSGVVQLAYSFKKPVICTRVGALDEVVKNGKTGILIEPKNSKQLANAIIKLIKNPGLSKRMGEAGYVYAKNELSWEAISKKTLNAYKEAIHDKIPKK
jgi:glycosyltransferase involved in cell wall biosynthesis